MQKVFFSLLASFFLLACSNSGRSDNNAATGDSIKSSPSMDTMRVGDTTSYERNNVTGADSTKK